MDQGSLIVEIQKRDTICDTKHVFYKDSVREEVTTSKCWMSQESGVIRGGRTNHSCWIQGVRAEDATEKIVN